MPQEEELPRGHVDSTVDTSHSMVEAIVSGSDDHFEKGFERFCVLYHLSIRKWCRRWFKADADADDAAQELILMLRKRLSRYRPEENVRFRNWLMKVSRNAARDLLRRSKRKSQIATVDFPAEPSLEDEGFVAELIVDFERRTLVRNILGAARDELSPRDREVLASYLQDEPSFEAASRMGITQSAVNQAMHRIRQKLKGQICDIAARQPNFEIEDLFAES